MKNIKCLWIFSKKDKGMDYVCTEGYKGYVKKCINNFWDDYENQNVVIVEIDSVGDTAIKYINQWTSGSRFIVNINNELKDIKPNTYIFLSTNNIPVQLLDIKQRFEIICV